jgi:hypothetical protein
MLKLRRMRTGSRCSRAKRRQPACLSRSRKLRQGGAMTFHPNMAAPASFCDRGLAVAYKRELSPSSNALSICHGTYDVSIWPVTSSMLSSNPDRWNVDDRYPTRLQELVRSHLVHHTSSASSTSRTVRRLPLARSAGSAATSNARLPYNCDDPSWSSLPRSWPANYRLHRPFFPTG